MPAALTKEAALAEVIDRLGAAKLAAAGDSLLDRGMLAIADVAELLSSELVTNAVVHARTSVQLEAAYDDASVPSQLRIDVYDRSPDEVDRFPRPPEDGAEGGRGLAIVARLASRWGVDSCTPGKRVWFTLANGTHPTDIAGRD